MEANGQLHQRSAIILYGTETGTSQDLAEETARFLQRLSFETDVVEFDAISYNQLSSYDLVIFTLSTTGQGDFPNNARKFWTALLRKKLKATTLIDVEYALIGLGDSSYPKFNWAARKLDKRLKQLGASELVESCEADEQGEEGTEGCFLEWIQRFRAAILSRFPLPPGIEPVPENVQLPSKWQLRMNSPENGLTVREDQHHESTLPNYSQLLDGKTEDTFPVVVESNNRVTPGDHWQDVRFLSLRSTRCIDYMPGDALSISPRNMPADVDSLIERMGWHEIADCPLKLVSQRQADATDQLHCPPIVSKNGLTLRTIFTQHLDIIAIPRRSFFAAISNYTENEMHRERLIEFTDPQYLDEYFDYATRPRRSILEILQEFDSVKLPWQEITNIFPKLRPRQFSIASGGNLKFANSGAKFELLVAIVKYRTVIKRIREGVCTRYLAQLPVGSEINVTLKTEGRFSSGQEIKEKDHILIGAGTGIAPLRSLIYEKASSALPNRSTTVIFGARNANADYFFHNEWTDLSLESLPQLQIITAFSRDQKQKLYVQDRIREHGLAISKSLQQNNTTVIVCGASGQMPKAVRQALVDVLIAYVPSYESTESADGLGSGSLVDRSEAEQLLTRMEKEGRYKQETWS